MTEKQKAVFLSAVTCRRHDTGPAGRSSPTPATSSEPVSDWAIGRKYSAFLGDLGIKSSKQSRSEHKDKVNVFMYLIICTHKYTDTYTTVHKALYTLDT